MFSTEERDRLRSELLQAAEQDGRIAAAAITGSGAGGGEDRWSDIDLAFGVKTGTELPDVLAGWTDRMYGRHEAVHHMDVHAGPWVYRVFLLKNTLQVDLAFVPASEFRAMGPTFRLVFGEAREPRAFPSAAAGDLAAMGWLYALHARSSIPRGKLWQAEYMISGVRDHAMAMACLRHGLPAVHGRGVDQLPEEERRAFEDSLVRTLDRAEMARAFRAAVTGLIAEIEKADRALGERLRPVLTDLCETGAGDKAAHS